MPAFDYSKPHSNSHITSETEWSDFMRYAVPSGVVLDTFTALQVYGDSSGKQVKVRVGACFVDGVNAENTSEKTVTLEDNTSGNPRIDRIVARLDRIANTVEATYVKGTPAATPVAPAITNSASVVDITLAKVAIANGYSTVAVGDVTDERQISTGIDGQSGNRIRVYDNTLTATTASIDTGAIIPQTFRDIEVNITSRSTGAVTAAVVKCNFNNDSSGVYDWQRSQEVAAYALAAVSPNQTYARLGTTSGASSTAGRFGTLKLELPDYTNTTFGRNFTAESVYQNTADTLVLERAWGVWGVSAINQLVFTLDTGSFAAASRITVDVLR